MNWPTLTSMGLKTINQDLWVLDQTRLPLEENWIRIESAEQMADCIYKLQVRGAPLIGVAAGMALALEKIMNRASRDVLKTKSLMLRNARPTAVNLANALDRFDELMASSAPEKQFADLAEYIFNEDVRLCDRMAKEGSQFVSHGDGVLTHCNAGALATVGIGTALGVITKAHRDQKNIHVFVDETRPLYQGARLTAWELSQCEVPFTLICDNMAATVMVQGKVQKVFVGADRIAINGDFANKIGTYNLAVLAKHHGIPFYVVAPETTVDLNAKSAKDIPIEERKSHEITGGHTSSTFCTFNPAFDITPRDLVTGYIGCKNLLHI